MNRKMCIVLNFLMFMCEMGFGEVSALKGPIFKKDTKIMGSGKSVKVDVPLRLIFQGMHSIDLEELKREGKEFKMTGKETWVGIYKDEIRVNNEMKFYDEKSRNEFPLTQINDRPKGTGYTIMNGESDGELYTFTGVKDLKEGKFAVPKMEPEECLEKGPQVYLDEDAKPRNAKTGDVCKIAVTKGKLGEKEFSVRRVIEKTLSTTTYSEYFIEIDGNKTSLGKYEDKDVKFDLFGDFNHDGNPDFIFRDGLYFNVWVSDGRLYKPVVSGHNGE